MYASTYQSQGEPDPDTEDIFFENQNVTKLSKDSINGLDADINLDEINTVIYSFPNNKAAGPDGLHVEFF